MATVQYRITQVVFVICNFLFLIMGGALIVVGAYLQVARAKYLDAMPGDDFSKATALLIASGTLVVVVCLIGFIGVWIRSYCIMLIFFLIVVITLALAIAGGIIAYVFHDKIDSEVSKRLTTGLRDPRMRKKWDTLQKEEHCCGVNNYTDWYGVVNPTYPTTLPDSCCNGLNCGVQGAVVAYDTACFQKAKDWITYNFYMLGAAGIALGVLQIILLVSSIILIFMMRREKKYMA